jgi:hypothetical protein
LKRGLETGCEASIQMAADYQAIAIASEDYQEGITA